MRRNPCRPGREISRYNLFRRIGSGTLRRRVRSMEEQDGGPCMRYGSILILNGDEVGSLLSGRMGAIIDAVQFAYEAHARGLSSLPHSTFLRFPESDCNRIIALPAYLAG